MPGHRSINVPTRNHPHKQGELVIEGEVEFTIADQTRLLTSGDMYLIPTCIDS
jgi:quercetin dioxygenase-like cupin family protein